MIGEDIEIRISRIDGDIVKIGIQAPRSVPVHRKEVFDAIGETNKEAVASASMQASAASLLANYTKKQQGSGQGCGHVKNQ